MIPALARQRLQFDLDSVLNPIRPDAPSGDNLRYEGTYDAIRKLREEDDPALALGVWKHELRVASWPKVADTALEALRSKTKDIQIAVWLTEAWLNQYGLDGLKDGLQVCTALLDRFWETMWPGGNTEDLEYRSGPIDWMNERLVVPLKLLQLTEGDEKRRPLCFSDWERALKAGNLKADKLPEGFVTTAQFEGALSATSTEYLLGVHQGILDCTEVWLRLRDMINVRWPDDGPGVGQIGATLEQLMMLVRPALEGRMPAPEAAPAAVAASPAATEGGESAMAVEQQQSGGGGPIRNRADAYRMLEEAAEYLARTEPHSPTPYLVRRAITWGQLKFEDLMNELIQNRTEVESIYHLLQIKK